MKHHERFTEPSRLHCEPMNPEPKGEISLAVALIIGVVIVSALLLTASAVGAQPDCYSGYVAPPKYWYECHKESSWVNGWCFDRCECCEKNGKGWRTFRFSSRPLSDSAILCQPYFDLAIPDDIKNSVLWMFCDSIKYVVSANLSSQISTDIVYYTYYGAMTYYDRYVDPNVERENGTWNLVYYTPYREYGLTDWHTPFAVLWQRKVMWKYE